MNVIDQAFAKAYSRRTKSQSTESATGRAVASGKNAGESADMSIHPQAEESAVVWIDAVADQYLRRDSSHQAPSESPADAGTLRGPRTRHAARGTSSPVAPACDQAPLATPHRVDLSLLCHTQIALAAQPEERACDEFGCLAASETGPEPTVAPASSEAPASSTPLAAVAAPTPEPPPSAATTAARGAAPTPASEPFTAAWEVDTLEFSSTVTALFGNRALVDSIGFPLDRAVSEGLQTLLITSDRSGAGQTSVATGIALAAAAAGLRVALVDANSAVAPAQTLAAALSLDVQRGWLDAIRGGLSLAETSIHSIEDQLTVIPQSSPAAGPSATADEFGEMIQRLRAGFDLVVIDGPPCQEPAFQIFTSPHQGSPHQGMSDSIVSGPTPPGSSPVDAVILVQDVRNADTELATQFMRSLKRQGITGLGLVENFT